MNGQWIEKKSHGVLLGALIFLSYFFLMFGNGIVSLTHPDEVFYIQTAKEMVQHKSWLTPMIFDKPQFEKPVFSYLLFASGIKWFGLSPFVARFWPAFFGILGVVITYWVSFQVFARRTTAFLSGAILASSFIHVALSRAVLTDMIFSVWVTLAIGLFYAAYKNQKSFGILMGAWGIVGLAVLTKGILGLLFPLTALGIYLLYKRDLKFLIHPKMFWGFVLFLLVALPWHWSMWQQYGNTFIQEYWQNVHIRRIFEAEHARLDKGYIYFMVIFLGNFPWSFFLIPMAFLVFRHIQQKGASADQLVFLSGWIVAIFIFVQPAHSKLASYILPVFPAFAILLAYTFDRIFIRQEEEAIRSKAQWLVYLFALALSIAAIVGPFVAKQYQTIILDMKTVYIAAAFFLLTALLMALFAFKKQYGKMFVAFMGVTLSLLAALFLTKPFIEPWVSCKDISDVFKKIDQSKTVVLTSKFYARGVRYYTDRDIAVIDIAGKGFFSPHPVPFLNEDHEVVEFFEARPVTYAILKEGNVEDVHRILQGRPFKIEHLEGIGGKYILRVQKI